MIIYDLIKNRTMEHDTNSTLQRESLEMNWKSLLGEIIVHYLTALQEN